MKYVSEKKIMYLNHKYTRTPFVFRIPQTQSKVKHKSATVFRKYDIFYVYLRACYVVSVCMICTPLFYMLQHFNPQRLCTIRKFDAINR